MGISTIYFDCGCEFEVDDGVWDCNELCKKHRDKLCKEDLCEEEEDED